MKVGITLRAFEKKEGWVWDVFEQDYQKYYPRFGITLIPLSNVLEDPVKFIEDEKIEGLILTGGNAVDPKLFGEEITFPNSFSDDRERTEKLLIDYAVKKKMPILGVCRGLHILNVYFGGKLLQSIKDQLENAIVHVAKDHELFFSDEKTKEYFGTEKTAVNSFHHQAITHEILSPKLKSFAICTGDNSIEAAYHPDLPIAAVTWHPERKSPDEAFNAKLIQAFVSGELFWKQK